MNTKKEIAKRERKVAKYLAKIAVLRDHKDRLDRKLCRAKMELYELRQK